MDAPLGNAAIRASKEVRKDLLLVKTLRVTVDESGITKGLAFRLCGAIGVITKLLVEGSKIGPPQLNEYPVDPVGVETISPSAQ